MSMPTTEQIRRRAAACHTWVSHDLAPTRTVLNWVKQTDTTHVVKRSGWSFTVRTPRPGYALLLASHTDGRSHEQAYESTRAAKAGAYDVMHPAEALGMTQVRSAQGVAGGAEFHYAVSGRFSFVVLRLPDDSRHLSAFDTVTGGAAAEMLCPSVADARTRIGGFLMKTAAAPEMPEQAPQSAAERLAAALMSAGVDVTPGTLSAALTACGLSLA